MLTGAPPGRSIIEVLAEEKQAECIGCLLKPIRKRSLPRRIMETSQLSSEAREVLTAFAKKPDCRFTVADSTALKWLQEQSAHGPQWFQP